MIFAKIDFWEIVSAKINLGLKCVLLRRGSASARLSVWLSAEDLFHGPEVSGAIFFLGQQV